MSFVPCALSTQSLYGLFITDTVLTWRKEGKACTVTELAMENLGRDRPSEAGASVTEAPCVDTNSLVWGEKCRLVIEAPRSSIPGIKPLELELPASTFHRRRMPFESPEARILGCHVHQATAYNQVNYDTPTVENFKRHLLKLCRCVVSSSVSAQTPQHLEEPFCLAPSNIPFRTRPRLLESCR